MAEFTDGGGLWFVRGDGVGWMGKGVFIGDTAHEGLNVGVGVRRGLGHSIGGWGRRMWLLRFLLKKIQ